MEKIVYLIVKSYFDKEGNLKEVCPVIIFSSKSVAVDSLSGFKKIEDVYNEFSSKERLVYEIKDVELL